MAKKFTNSTVLGSGLNITSQTPTDDRGYFKTEADLIEYATNNGRIIPDGLVVMVTNNPSNTPESVAYTEYIWAQSNHGLLDVPYEYLSPFPPEYYGKKYNFVVHSTAVTLEQEVSAGQTMIQIQQKYLPLHVLVSGAANVTLYEEVTAGSNEFEPAFPDSARVATNGITHLRELQVLVAPGYAIGMKIKVKIS